MFLRTTVPVGDERLAEALEGGYEGLAFGAEFCARRLPPAAVAADLGRRCAGGGMGFSLVTPILREKDFDGVAELVAAVSRQAPGTECVINDWGLLEWLRQERLDLEIAAGRMLSRQRRDPRVLDLMVEADPDEARALQGSVWNDPAPLDLIQQAAVQRVELDFLLQGTGRPHLPPEISLSVCAPWLPVTFSPDCSWSGDPIHCGQECGEHPPAQQWNSDTPYPLWSQGNTLFVYSDLHVPYQAVAKLGADRLVWAEGLPG